MASVDREAPKCHVCTSPFRFGGPEPYLMPCLHSVCQTCIALDCETIFCSSCEQQFPNDNSFPKDTVEAKSVFLTTLKHRPSEVWCTNRNDGRKATSWCPQCEALLCRTCEEMHKDIKLTKVHEVIPLSSLLQEQEGLNPQAIPCPHHPELHLLLYDEECKTLICYKCKAEDHAECTTSDPGSVCDQFKKLYLPEAMTQLEEKKEELASTEIEINDLLNILDPKLMAVKESISQSFENLRVSLKQRENELKEQAEQCFKEVKENTNRRFKELNLENVRLDTILSMCRKSQNLSFPPQLLSMKQSMITRADEISEKELPKVSKMEAEITFSNTDEEDLQQVISSAGLLYTTWYYAASPLPFPLGTLSAKRAQLERCLEEKHNIHRTNIEELKNTNDMLYEKELQLERSQEERRQSEEKLAVFVEKMKIASSFIEKASFTVPLGRNFEGPSYSIEQVLKTLPCFIKVTERHGNISSYVYIRQSDARRDYGWSCRVKATFSVLGKEGAPIIRYLDHVWSGASYKRGFSKLISTREINEAWGTVKLKVDVEAWESNGLVPLEDQFRKEFDEAMATLERQKSKT